MDPRRADPWRYTISGRSLALAGGNEGPLWVKPGPRGTVATRPLSRQKRNSKRHSTMSQ